MRPPSETRTNWNEIRIRKTVIAHGSSCGLFLSQNRKEQAFMSESSNSAWPFGEISGEEGLDIEAIFKDSTGADQSNPFASPVETAAPDPTPEAQEPPAEPAEPAPAPNPAAVSAPTPKELEMPATPAPKPTAAPPAEKPQEIPSPRPLNRKRRRTPRKDFWKSRRSSITRVSKRRSRTPP